MCGFRCTEVHGLRYKFCVTFAYFKGLCMTYLQMPGTRYANFMPTALFLLLSSAVYAQVYVHQQYELQNNVITVSACIKIYIYYSTQNLMMLPLDFLHYMIVLPHHGITSLHEITSSPHIP